MEFLREKDLLHHLSTKKGDLSHNNSVVPLEQEAKSKKLNYYQKSDFFLKAALIRSDLGQVKDVNWNFANHYYFLGLGEFNCGKISEGMIFFSKALKIFDDLGIENMIVRAANYYLESLTLQRRNLNEIENEQKYKLNLQQSLEILSKYDTLENDKLKIKYLPKLLLDKIWFYRRHYDFDSASKYAVIRLNYAEKLYKQFPNIFRNLRISSLKINFECSARKLERFTLDYNQLAEFYAKNANLIEPFDFYYSTNVWANYYKYKALIVIKHEIEFLNYINKAIDWAKKDSKSKNLVEHLKKIKYRRISKNSPKNLGSQIQKLEEQKIISFKNKRINEGKLLLYDIELLKAQKAEEEGDFKKSLSHLAKGLKHSKDLSSFEFKYENIQKKIIHLNFKNALFNRNFSEANHFIHDWLQYEEENKFTRNYLKNQINYVCTKILAKTEDQINKTDAVQFQEIYEKYTNLKITSPFLTEFNQYLHNCKSGTPDDVTRNRIIIKFLKWSLGPKTSIEIDRLAIIETSLIELTWIENYPSFIQEKYQKIILLYNDIIPSQEANEFLLSQMYKLLEKVLEIYIEYKSKLFSGNGWKRLLEESTGKDFDRLTFGEYIYIFELYSKKENIKSKNIEDIQFLLNKHLKYRNKLAHEFINIESEEVNQLLNEITQILFLLHSYFPVCGLIESQHGNNYQVNILRNKYPNIFRIYVKSHRREKFLDKGEFYYFFPRECFDTVLGEKVFPKKIMSSYYLSIHLRKKKIKRDIIILSANSTNSFADEIFNLINKSEENVKLISLIRSFLPDKNRIEFFRILFKIYGRAYIVSPNNENIFQFPYKIFQRILIITELLFGKIGKRDFIYNYQIALTSFFKNLLFGEKAGKILFPSNKFILIDKNLLNHLIEQFKQSFGTVVSIPTTKEILLCCSDNIKNVSNVYRFLSMIGFNPSELITYKKPKWIIETLKIQYSEKKNSNILNQGIVLFTISQTKSGDLLKCLEDAFLFIKSMIEEHRSFDVSMEEFIFWIHDTIYKILTHQLPSLWKFSNKEDVMKFIDIFKKSAFKIGFQVKSEELFLKIKAIFRKIGFHLKFDEIINGPLNQLYISISNDNFDLNSILNYLDNKMLSRRDRFEYIYGSFIDIIKEIIRNNDFSNSIELIKTLVDKTKKDNFMPNYLDVLKDFDMWTSRLIKSIINNKKGKWGENFVFYDDSSILHFSSLIIDFFCNLGLEIPSEIHDRILKSSISQM